MDTVWNEEQMRELEEARRRHPKAHIRTKALGLWNLGRGRNQSEVADFLGVDRHTVCAWTERYAAQGLSGLEVKAGRGRISKVDEGDVKRVLEQTPRQFGIAQERWTLRALREAVPSLAHLKSLRSVGYVMHRIGLAPKRGQYRRSSPDPDYVKKKTYAQWCVQQAREKPEEVVALYEDETTMYRQPSQGWLWAWMGRRQPRISFSHRNNTRTRVIAVLNAVTGAVHHSLRAKIDRRTFARFLLEAGRSYPRARRIYVILDCWPVHFHPDARTILSRDRRIRLVDLPTYSPWLNYAEKLWRWLRQRTVHCHPYADDFVLFKHRISESLDCLSQGSTEILRYTGLMAK